MTTLLMNQYVIFAMALRSKKLKKVEEVHVPMHTINTSDEDVDIDDEEEFNDEDNAEEEDGIDISSSDNE
ncbi:hypothetical protein Tco_1266610 [Tanacetum coccineum]